MPDDTPSHAGDQDKEHLPDHNERGGFSDCSASPDAARKQLLADSAHSKDIAEQSLFYERLLETRHVDPLKQQAFTACRQSFEAWRRSTGQR